MVVIYCLANCWMSWNAAKRASALGYSNVVWFPEGTDGWLAAGLPLQDAEPEPRPPQ
jgi:PQQ-dependent catabolism-associated CXXCW motif protein